MKKHLNNMQTCCEFRKFIKSFSSDLSCLEISPYHSPLLKNTKCKTFDVVNKEKLVDKCKNDINIKDMCGNINEVDYVNEKGDLSMIDNKFDLIVSSHCIEHTTDILQHLLDVSNLLNSEGIYVCFIPNRAYCFDHYKTPKSAADIIEAHVLKRKRPSLKTFIETLLYTCHNDPSRHWNKDSGHWNLFNRNDLDNIISEYISKEKNEEYTDLHNWQFTLEEFLSSFAILKQLNYFPNLNIFKTINTNKNSNEFCIVFEKN